MKAWILIIVLLLLGVVSGTSLYFSLTKSAQKVGYVLNAQLLKGYKGTEDVQRSISKKFENTRFQMDSLKAVYMKLSEVKQSSRELEIRKAQIKNSLERMTSEEQEVSLNAEGQLWNQINSHVSAFGKANKYSMIIGASGNGNLMFADSTLNVTSQVIEFMNQKYVSGK